MSNPSHTAEERRLKAVTEQMLQLLGDIRNQPSVSTLHPLNQQTLLQAVTRYRGLRVRFHELWLVAVDAVRATRVTSRTPEVAQALDDFVRAIDRHHQHLLAQIDEIDAVMAAHRDGSVTH